jgi:hypothetical protein
MYCSNRLRSSSPQRARGRGNQQDTSCIFKRQELIDRSVTFLNESSISNLTLSATHPATARHGPGSALRLRALRSIFPVILVGTLLSGGAIRVLAVKITHHRFPVAASHV